MTSAPAPGRRPAVRLGVVIVTDATPLRQPRPERGDGDDRLSPSASRITITPRALDE